MAEPIFENSIYDLLQGDRRTQQWLAKEIEKSPVQVNNYCKNKIQPPLNTAQRIATALKVTVNDLIKVPKAA